MKLPGLAYFRLCTLTDAELTEKVAKALCDLYSEPSRVPTRHIPAKPNEDFDLLVSEMILRYRESRGL